MSTYLELCQAVARESGTVADLTSPSTVTGQTGRLLRIVNWTAQAWKDIQNARSDWRWMRKEFAGDTIATIRRYSINTGSERFRSWVFDTTPGAEHSFSAYLTATGKSTERKLISVHWDEFRKRYLFGTAEEETGSPTHISVDPANQLVLYPIPDAVWTIRGEFMRGPQILSDDDDTPELPLEHHDAIMWKALILMGGFDEAVEQDPYWARQLAPHMDSLIATQTPRITLGGPLA